ncbi:hypothetical protein [Nonomuraea sp. NPDC049709]|uniref:hypothetical protein n=1 Tax=Nonomuraea sp. NPDC049709 TaxID=3154736 RepID=UPI003448150C
MPSADGTPTVAPDAGSASTSVEPPADAEKSARPAASTEGEGSEAPTDTGAAADAPKDTGSSAGPEGERPRRVTRAKVLGALAAMVVAAIAATAVLQWLTAAQAQDARARLESERALRMEVSGAAAAFSRALLSYDYKDLQTTRSALAAQATGDFLATYDAAFGGTMAQVIVKLEATSQATVREVYLADVDEATAHAIVVVDQQVNTSEAIRSVKDSHLKISLVKEKGSWKIHDVTVLGAASEDQYSLDGDDKKKD